MADIHVRIGEVKTGSEGDVLKATLGSCVGIAFYWPTYKRCGLAHCLLPDSKEASDFVSGKYVNHAVDALMHLMKIQPHHVREVEVTIAGGGRMMGQLFSGNSSQVGKLNVEAVYEKLKSHGFLIRNSDLLSNVARQIVFDCSTGKVEIVQLIEPTEELKYGND